jgi:hypothetical protein
VIILYRSLFRGYRFQNSLKVNISLSSVTDSLLVASFVVSLLFHITALKAWDGSMIMNYEKVVEYLNMYY